MNVSRSHRHGGKALSVSVLAGASLLLAACGGGALTGGAAADASGDRACEEFPPSEVTLMTGAGPTSGFTTWLHVVQPFLADRLGTDVVVENLPGAGHLRALTEVYSRTGDGSTIMLIDSGDIAMNQLMGRTSEGVDLAQMPHYGQLEEGARVWLVDADSPVETFEDLKDLPQPVRFGANQYNPVSVLTFDRYDIEPTYILMEGTGEIALALQRGDADVMIGAISSVESYLEAGELKPILYLNTEEITEDSPGYEYLRDAPTPDDPSLAKETQMVRTLVGPPEVPQCVQDQISEAVAAVNSDPAYVEAAEEAGLDPTSASREGAREHAEMMLDNLGEMSDVIERATQD